MSVQFRTKQLLDLRREIIRLPQRRRADRPSPRTTRMGVRMPILPVLRNRPVCDVAVVAAATAYTGPHDTLSDLEELGGSLSSWVSAQAETISDDDYKNTVSQDISYALSHAHGRDR